MKAILYIIPMLALAACSGDEVINTTNNDPNEIRLSVTTNMHNAASSRAVHTSASTFSKSFQIFAVKTATAHSSAFDSYIDNETVNYNTDGTWSFSLGKHYWPGEKLNFYAFHFASSDETKNYESTFNKTESTDLVYNEDKKCVGVQVKNVQVAISSQIAADGYSTTYQAYAQQLGDDMLYAVAAEQQNDDNNSGTVSLNFRHALSNIQISSESNSSHIYVEIPAYGIQFCGFQNKGDVFFGADETSTNFAEGDNNAYGYSSQCSWTPHDDNAANNYTRFSIEKVIVCNSVKTSEGDATSSISATTDYPYMFIPQPFNEGACNDGVWSGVYMKIRCAVYHIEDIDQFYEYSKNFTLAQLQKGSLSSAILKGTTDHPSPYGVMIFGDPNKSTPYKDLYVKIPEIKDADGKIIGWEPGKAYIYDLKWDINSDNVNAYNDDGSPAMVGIQLKVDKIDQWDANSTSTTAVNAGANQ